MSKSDYMLNFAIKYVFAFITIAPRMFIVSIFMSLLVTLLTFILGLDNLATTALVVTFLGFLFLPPYFATKESIKN